MAWSTSTRRGRLPADWEDIRQACKARANGKCQAAVHAHGCDGIGTDADHITAGDDHSLDNLQWLSEPCHRAKTALETADRNRDRAALRRRPTEVHPGAVARPAVGGDSPAEGRRTAG